MQTSVYLAQLMGPIIAIMGVYILVFPARIQMVGREFLSSAALMFLAGVLALLVGLAIVLSHNVWVMGWPVVITVFGWVAIPAGLLRLFMGPDGRAKTIELSEYKAVLRLAGAVLTIVGAWLVWGGYFAGT